MRGRDLGPLDAQGRGHGPNRQPLRCDLRRVWLGGKELGQRLNLTNAEREALKAWRIVPVDMTADDLAEQWKAKERERKRCKRATMGAKPRQTYEAASLSSRKPWLAEGISRRTWERRRRKAGVASVSATIVDKERNNLRHVSALYNCPTASSGNGVCVTDTPETEGQI